MPLGGAARFLRPMGLEGRVHISNANMGAAPAHVAANLADLTIYRRHKVYGMEDEA